MTKQSNELVALEWLIEPLNKELDDLHAYGATSVSDLLLHFSREYNSLSNVLLMANLPEFNKLARVISEASHYFATLEKAGAFAPKIIYASRLLQHEINRYATIGFVRRSMLNTRTCYLGLVYAHVGGNADKQGILQSAVGKSFSGQVNLAISAVRFLDDKSYQEIHQAWKVLAGQLIQSGVNGDQLTKLRNVSTHLASATNEITLQKLWLLTALWLENIALNGEPLPHYYAHILGELDRVIVFQKTGLALELEASIWMESLIVDMYVMLASLNIQNESAQNLFKHLNEILEDDQTFFPHILTTIEGLVFALADNKIQMDTLHVLQEQLSGRGWSFYARYVEQIISDANTAQSSDEMFAQMQWQLNTQLQDLYTAIASTAEVINAKENQYDTSVITGERDVLREVRILMEEIKDRFAVYLQDKQVNHLPSIKHFESLIKNFNDMGLFDAAGVATKLLTVFEKLQVQALAHISWQLAHKVAESLSLFEMFLDNLAQQVLDHALLTRTEECIDGVATLLDGVSDGDELAQIESERQSANRYNILYDDMGEHDPVLVNDVQDVPSIFDEPLPFVQTGQMVDSLDDSFMDTSEGANEEQLTPINLDDAQIFGQAAQSFEMTEEQIDSIADDGHLGELPSSGFDDQNKVNESDSSEPSLNIFEGVHSDDKVLEVSNDDWGDDVLFEDFDADVTVNEMVVSHDVELQIIDSQDEMNDAYVDVLEVALDESQNVDADCLTGDILKSQGYDIQILDQSIGLDKVSVLSELNTDNTNEDINPKEGTVSDNIGQSDDDESIFDYVFTSSFNMSLNEVDKPANQVGGESQNDDLDDWFDDSLVFDDNFGIDDIKQSTQESHAQPLMAETSDEDDMLIFDDGLTLDDEIVHKNEVVIESTIDIEMADELISEQLVAHEVAVDDLAVVLDVCDAIDNPLSDDQIELDLSGEDISIDWADDKDNELTVDELPQETESEQSDDGLLVAVDEEIRLSDYVDEGTVDNVIPSLDSSELLSDASDVPDELTDTATDVDIFDESIVFDDAPNDTADDVEVETVESELADDVVMSDDAILADEVELGEVEPGMDEPIPESQADETAEELMFADEENILIGDDEDLMVSDDDAEIESGLHGDTDTDEILIGEDDEIIFDDDPEDVDVALEAESEVSSKTQADEYAEQSETQMSESSADDATEHNIPDSQDDDNARDISEVYLTAKASLKEDDFSHDEEFREIFIEEVDEVMEEMHTHLPKWQADPQNLKPLKDIRRNWHTLKGSGRMVGAFQVGETAWAIENMLNRVLDETVKVSPDVVAIVSETAEIIPVMVQDFASSQPPSVDNALVVMRANNILAGRPMDEGKPEPAGESIEDGIQDEPLVEPVETDELVSDDVADDNIMIGEDDEPIGDELAGADEIESVSEEIVEAGIANDEQDQTADMPAVLLPFIEIAKATTHESMEVDEDIREIYIEEAGEVLETIIPLFNKYQNNPNKTVLTDIRRGFHTLKGSGRMVGAYELGELAWSIENMLNRVLDETVPMDGGMQALIGDVLAEFGSLVAIFESKSDDYPAKIKLWEAIAHAYSKGHGKEFDYRALNLADDITDSATESLVIDDMGGMDIGNDVDEQVEEPSSSHGDDVQAVTASDDEAELERAEMDDVQNNVEDVEIEETANKTTNEALSLVEQAGQLMSSTVPSSPADDEEDMLCQIFIEEARELLADVSAFLDAHEQDGEVAVDNDVVRAFHTLRGASGLAPLVAVGEVGAIIESGLQSLQHHDAPMGNKHKQALKDAVILIETHLDAYNNTNSEASSQAALNELDGDRQEIEQLMAGDIDVYHVESLIEGIDDLLDAELELESMSAKEAGVISDYAKTQLAQIDMLSARTHDLPKFQSLLASLKSAYELMAEHTEQAKDDTFIDALLAVHHELIGLFDAMAGSMALTVDKAILNTLNGITLERESYYQELGSTLKEQSKKEQSKTQEETTQVIVEHDAGKEISPVRLESIGTDDELLEIFLEEALELDAEVTEVFGQWREDKDNLDYLKTLQRHLHTIKGGARLAGISSIGDLTHEAESVYERFTNKQMTVTDPWVRTMQRVQDVLSLQLDAVKNTKLSFFADNTIADLQAYLSAGEVPEGVMIAIPILESKKEEVAPVSVQPTTSELDEGVRYESLIEDSWQGNLPDKDILGVFLEEAKDLAESSGEDFAAFRHNTSDVASLQALQRKLHTIKGGARMVSANGVADLAHEMETVYEDLGNRRLPATRMVANLLFACHDWITAAVGLLENNYNPPRPTPLIDALHRFIKKPDSLNEVPTVSLEKEIDFINEYQAFLLASKNTRDISRMPPMKGVFGESVDSSNNNEMIRISASLLERMINLSGEAAINRARIDMNLASITGSIEEMGMTVQRLFDQLRRMDIELEEQILAQIDDDTFDEDFDPLEMDQYSSLNQLSKSLSESASDLLDIKATMLDKTRDGENLLLQLSRTQADLQDSLMNSRMVPFSRLTPRLQRIVRQTASELGKNVELTVVNADDEMDRSILDRITSPLEHMLRNAVDHGVEMPTKRSELGKPLMGRITLEVLREGGEMVILLSDDGAGVNVEAVRNKAISQGLIHPDEQLSDNDIMQYIFNAGLSTTSKVTQISGRGVGMDVVRTEIRQLGGSVSVESKLGEGSRFIIRVPLTVAMSDALIVRVADRQYAIPLVQIERVVQMNASELLAYHQSGDNTIRIDNKNYRLRYLNEILTGNYFNEIISGTTLPVIIIKTQTGQALALQVDEIVGSRIEIVVKPLERQLSNLSGISAATIMGDGSVMLILDLLALMRTAQTRREVEVVEPESSRRRLIMVVDDSVTVRKVTSRFLERQGFEVIVAKDGVDAIEILQDAMPDLMLLDIEMPRMDGFEVATQVRHSPRLSHLPIIMITSRTGEKHRERAFEIGVNDYMGKPFQEVELLERIGNLLNIKAS